MLPRLSEGVLDRILSDQNIENPTVQILTVHQAGHTNGVPRYWVRLSDTVNTDFFAIISLSITEHPRRYAVYQISYNHKYLNRNKIIEITKFVEQETEIFLDFPINRFSDMMPIQDLHELVTPLTIGEILDQHHGSEIDLMGIITRISELDTFYQEKDEEGYIHRRFIEIYDTAGDKITLQLWNRDAREFEADQFEMILIIGGSLGRTTHDWFISKATNTRIVIEPKLPRSLLQIIYFEQNLRKLISVSGIEHNGCWETRLQMYPKPPWVFLPKKEPITSFSATTTHEEEDANDDKLSSGTVENEETDN